MGRREDQAAPSGPSARAVKSVSVGFINLLLSEPNREQIRVTQFYPKLDGLACKRTNVVAGLPFHVRACNSS